MPWITAETMAGSTLRNDYPLGVGMSFTVGAADLHVTDLGRWVVAGNSQSHVLSVYNSVSISDLIATATVATSGAPAGAFAYSSLASVVTLIAGHQYYLLSLENSGGDQWYDAGALLPTTTADASLIGAAYDFGGGIGVISGSGTFGAVNFRYTT